MMSICNRTLQNKPREVSLTFPTFRIQGSQTRPIQASKRLGIRLTAQLKDRPNSSSSSISDLKHWFQQQQSRALYIYFRDWRKDAFSDLQAILLLALAVNVSLTAYKVLLGENGMQAWDDFYSAAVVTFGEAWPATTAPVTDQVSSIGLYLSGLIGFAVLLALVEQSVLQVYEARVELGSPVLEQGHLLVLAWCRSQADVSKLEVILRQLCAAYSSSGGRTLVVLSQRKKTEMEALFCATIPQAARGGSHFVFRQGNPLTAADHKLVAADDASVVLVLADSAASADASDSQVLRVLVLLDECEAAARQEGRTRPKPGHVVAEILSNDAMPLLKFMPTKPVLPLPSHRLNAMRLAVLVTRPVVSYLTDTLWDFSNSSAVYMHTFPQLVGHTIADIALSFEDGIVIGLLEASTGFVLINPPAAYRLGADERIILLRPTGVKETDVQPLPAPVSAPIGSYSPEAAAAAWQQSQQSLNMPMVISCGCSDVDPPPEPDYQDISGCQDSQADHQDQAWREYAAQVPSQQMPQQQLQDQLALLREQQSAPYRLLRDQQQQLVSGGATNVTVNSSSSEAITVGSQDMLNAGNGDKGAAGTAGSAGSVGSAGSLSAATAGAKGSAGTITGNGSSGGRAAGAGVRDGGCAVASWDLEAGDPLQSYEVMDLLKGTRPGFNTCRMFSLAEASVQLSRRTPLYLLVLGWQDQEFMTQLLLALATGSSALPAGSRVTFANAHRAEATLAPALAAAGPPELLAGLSVSHVQLDPLARCQLGKLDLQRANAAIVLCDLSWRHQLTPSTSNFASSAAAGAAGHSSVYAGLAGMSTAGSVSAAGSLDAAAPGVPSAAYMGGLGAAAGNGAAGNGAAGVYANGGGSVAGGADADVLQLDAILLRVQLNLRSVLQGIGREKEVNIITEKVGTEQETRFEDKARLPLGVPVNMSSYTACMMSQLAFCPLMVLPRTLGAQIDPLIVDADLYTDVGDLVSFWQLMRRALLLGHVLLGYYVLPVSASDPIEAVVCPPGQTRYERRVWNTGDNRLKFIVLQDAEAATSQLQQQQQLREEAVASVAGGAAARAAAAAKAAADASAMYYPVDSSWQWWMR